MNFIYIVFKWFLIVVAWQMSDERALAISINGNYTRMLHAILNKSWRQHPTRHQLYGHLPPITKTIQVRRTRHAGHCWRSRDELIRDVLLWTPTHGRAKAGWPARTYIQQLWEDTGCCPDDLPGAMNDREEWRERVRDIRATIYIYMCVCIKMIFHTFLGNIYIYIYIYIYICEWVYIYIYIYWSELSQLVNFKNAIWTLEEQYTIKFC